MQRGGAMIPLAFCGGSALRFLYSIKRFSEDLDFTLERPPKYEFQRYLEDISSYLTRLGYNVDLGKVRAEKTVHSAFVRFPGLLHELGLSGQPEEALAVKIEVDTNPPRGAHLETSLVRHLEILNLQHHDRATLLAGKLHAVLSRPYPKGRDFYDLVWYLSDRQWPSPNLEMLNNALTQTQWDGPVLTPNTWAHVVRAHVEKMPWDKIVADVRPFVENPAELELLTREKILGLLENRARRPVLEPPTSGTGGPERSR
jgi:hypothetical protein